ncbi:hypothetical protein Esi_0031_0001 [Ectocarpus siliculosus]|uniref:Uncharacterized protein n=1 Tax=Ectocarpus siliculosus TaxID=2880 RepID=D8LKS1_ECTSI|nr:hypothetical protein Esi_0031_0001 [Ectocarpus siliculosus]|eukprot:CBN80054.1 hypothetical protein Esi_0031_0001 [Ectocarpus siliculosus]
MWRSRSITGGCCCRRTVSQGKHNEALPLLERASSIRGKKLGENHHYTVDTQISLERVQKHVRERETNTGSIGTRHLEEAWYS